jgi:hypothetical protein
LGSPLPFIKPSRVSSCNARIINEVIIFGAAVEDFLWLSIAWGVLDGQSAFLSGKYRAEGNVGSSSEVEDPVPVVMVVLLARPTLAKRNFLLERDNFMVLP